MAQVPKLRCAALNTVAPRTRRRAKQASKGVTGGPQRAMVEGSGGAGASSCRGGALGPAARRCCGCGLGRLVRRLRRQGRQALCAAARPAPSSAEALRGCQYDPLSYARNFDHTGFGDPDADADAASSLYYSYTFSSRFVLAPGTATSSSVAAAVSAPNVIVVTAASH